MIMLISGMVGSISPLMYSIAYYLFRYTALSYCRNFTDIDDKIVNRAQKELGDSQQY